MRDRFDKQLADMNHELMSMAMLVESSISMAVAAMQQNDTEVAKSIILKDDEIDQKEREVERMCFMLLLSQQPVAGDLRSISTVLKMLTDLERIGDHASDISEITIMNAAHSLPIPAQIPKMAETAGLMVRNAIDAFIQRDLVRARAVIRNDDVVDQLFLELRNELIDSIRNNMDAQSGEHILDMLMVGKYFERIGDHAVNIAEWVVFDITGKHKDGTVAG
ncbi:MAG: phosphate signaling complex protein PhoU [Butyricicoccaceae bacterium]